MITLTIATALLSSQGTSHVQMGRATARGTVPAVAAKRAVPISALLTAGELQRVARDAKSPGGLDGNGVVFSAAQMALPGVGALSARFCAEIGVVPGSLGFLRLVPSLPNKPFLHLFVKAQANARYLVVVNLKATANTSIEIRQLGNADQESIVTPADDHVAFLVASGPDSLDSTIIFDCATPGGETYVDSVQVQAIK